MPTGMTQRARRIRASGLALATLTLTFAACGRDTVRYGPAPDDLAMTAITSAWSESGGLTLSLCEDLARSREWTGPDGCQVDHVVRGGGLGLAHEESHGGGCGGGCPYRVIAYVRGKAQGAGLDGEVPVSGTVQFQTGHADDPYAFPYKLRLSCGDGAPPCTLDGTLNADGQVTATLRLGDSGTEGAQRQLVRTGPATCP